MLKKGNVVRITFSDTETTLLQKLGIEYILGGMNLSRIQVLHFRNWSLFWKVVGKSVTEAASPIVCPFAFTYLNSALVIITSSYIKYTFIGFFCFLLTEKITLLQFFMVIRI